MKSKRTDTRLALPFAAAIVLFGLPAANAASYPATVLQDNPIAYYRLEETSGTTAFDSSASGAYAGTYNVDGAYPQLGQPGIDTNSISVSATANAYVSAGYYPDFNPQGPFSFEIWVRAASAPSGGAYRCPIGNFGGWSTGGGYGSGWYVYQTPTASQTPSALAFIMAPTGVWISAAYNLFTWYHLVGTYDGTNASFYVNGTLVGTQLANGFLANPGNPLCLGQRADSYGFWDGNLDEVAIYTNALSLDRIQAHYQVGTNSFRAPPVGASIRQDPASTTAYAGHAVQFTVQADGTAPLLYQWFKANNEISGATSSAYGFTCSTADDGAGFYAIVTNNYGSATSAVAILTVSTSLLIDAQPSAIVRNVGSKAAFLVAAEGALPISFQWYKGANKIQSATNQTLWLSNVQLTDDGSTYSAHVSNPYTSVDSDPATLNVQARAVTVPITGYAKVVMADDPVAYWRLDEPDGSSTATDAAGSFDGSYSAGSGTITYGAPAGIPHGTNAAVAISGGATVQIPYALELNPWGPFTIEGWFQPASLAANGNDYRTALSSMWNVGGVGPTGWLLYQQGNNTWAWVPYGGFWASVFLPDTTESVVANQWYYIALTYDGTAFTVYVNGVARTSGTYNGFVQNGNVPAGGTGTYHYMYDSGGSGPLVLGWRSDVDFNPFAGTMDDVAVYNKALAPQQIQAHYAATVRLTIVKSGNNVILSWPFGTLQSAPAIGGTYLDMPSASSPYTNTAPVVPTYYRVKAYSTP
jgi:Concanavalin A-like lectin/glucanases superfamily